MNSQWLLFIFLVLVIILAIDIMRRAIFAIINTRKDQKVYAMMRKLRRPTQPWVTVLVYGKNQAKELEKTVRKIKRSRYGQFDIVAVSDRSNDDTAPRMKRYIDKTNSQSQIQFLQRRASGTKLDAYRAAYRKSQRGKIIICLNANDEVDPLLIKRAVVSQHSKRRWQVRVPIVENSDGLMGVAKSLRRFLRENSKKAEVYTATAFRRSNAVAPRINLLSSFVWSQILLVSVIMLGVSYGGLMALWYAWVLFSLYLLALIWIHYDTPLSEKWKFSFSVPSALFLIPVVGLAEEITQLYIRK